MRLKLAALVLLVCGVGVRHARAQVRPGAPSRRRRDRSSAGATSTCTARASRATSSTSAREAGTVKFDPSGIPYDYTDLKRPICQALKRFPQDVRSAGLRLRARTSAECPQRYWEDALAVHTLAHEVWHLHGIGNEAQTECNALQTTARAAMLLGADARAAQATAVYALIRFYPVRAGRVPASRA